MLLMVEAFFGLNEHIVDIDLHGLAYQRFKYLGYQPLISRSGIFQAKRNYIVIVELVWCNEGRFLCVRWVHWNLMVSRESVQK